MNLKKSPAKPHYLQIVDAILEKVQEGSLSPGDALPSLNETAKRFQISRDTALAAYKILKESGAVKAIAGKGYFLTSNPVTSFFNIFLLFDELNSFKENLYNAFVAALGKRARVDIYFHHFNRKTFQQLIKESVGNYSHYVIMPAQFEQTEQILEALPSHKTFILDQSTKELDNLYSSVYQNFEKDIYSALLSTEDLLLKYNRFIMVHPGGKEPEGQKRGFERYCKEKGLSYQIIANLNKKTLQKGELYITPSDRYLVELVKQADKKRLKIGQEVGFISYNDTPLKEVVAQGITTISTDFNKMGENLAQLLSNNSKCNIQNPSSLIRRKSI